MQNDEYFGKLDKNGILPLKFKTGLENSIFYVIDDDELNEIKNNMISNKVILYMFYDVKNGYNYIKSEKPKNENDYGEYYTELEEKLYKQLTLINNYNDLINQKNIYFQKSKSLEYKFQTKQTYIIKNKILDLIEKPKDKYNKIFDIASGKGQDLKIIKDKNIWTEAIFIDNDTESLYELVKRKNTLEMHMKTIVKLMNFNKLSKKDYSFINYYKHKIHLVNNNLAIHYLTYNDNLLNNFYHIVNNLLQNNGYFIFTALDGKKVYNYLKKYKEFSSYFINTDLEKIKKYQIKISNLQNVIYKSKISIKLPFSDNNYDEYLVDFDRIRNKFNNYDLIFYESFSMFFLNRNYYENYIYENLTNDDKKYLDFYSFMILKKKSN